ncbi:MAG: sodium-dependent transporter [Pseudobdellovibrionaceae bacterium]
MPKRGSWKTRFGFYLAAIGSACGLGNLWRFPYVVGENGGGAFVLLYVMFSLLIGLPLLIGELMLGKSTHKSILAATHALSGPVRKFVWVGRFAVFTSLVVLSYYAVISGWVLHFSTQFFVGMLSPQMLMEKGRLDLLLSNGWLQMGLASVHLLLTIVVVLKGVQEGLEKWIGAMMPIFAILLILLVIKSLSLDSAPQALRFLLYPDFSKLQLSSPLHAIGHVCFTLSVGFGTMVTFGSYLRDGDHIPTAGFRVAIVDTMLSLFAGLLLFPIVLQASNIPLTDPGLLFEALPRFLLQMPGGVAFGFAFFVCLYLAALGASIGLLEVIVSNVVDRTKISRVAATWLSGAVALFLGALPALSSTTFKFLRIEGKSLLEILDGFLINVFLPLIALGIAWAVRKGLNKQEQEKIFVDQNKIESVALYPHWRMVMTWVIPLMIAFAFFLQILALVKGIETLGF